ncbi:uncharacterized protein LOC130666107 [Microplitis mediator]|uniref:uncharacterized protein LOC130666107 n=1 Tax=Microplitis mediator TaxID=375433 RepID=UPI002554618F|nr:uncharacterized protein LOC130666107 [Microplitis mediator]XP_057322796.1 uncharacterized protein LOC130666107 [Microplitis mediator]
MEEAGVTNANPTPDVKAILEFLKAEKKARKEVENLLEKKTLECEQLEDQLKKRSCNCSQKSTFSQGLSLLMAIEERNYNRLSGGERYTKNEIIFSLNIFKRSPKCYRFLQSLFQLPSEKTLKRSFADIKLHPGFNDIIFPALDKATSRSVDKLDAYCAIFVDETSVKKRVTFTEGDDSVTGFHDDGNGCRKPDLADHVTVFMLQQLHGHGKQPLSFHFTKGPMSTEVLKSLITQLIERIVAANKIKIVAMVSDQGSTNKGAFNLLINDTVDGHYTRNFFTVSTSTEKIYIFYDGAHLMKTTKTCFSGAFDNWVREDQANNKRNEYEGRIIHLGSEKAYWRDVVDYYETDPNCHLTEDHIYSNNKVKMNVGKAAQVLSATTARNLIKRGRSNPIQHPTAEETGRVIGIIDEMFDSLNGSKIVGNDPKITTSRALVTKNSSHFNDWFSYRKLFASFKFIIPNKKVQGNRQSASKENQKDNHVKTTTPKAILNNLSSATDLCRYLLDTAGFESINMRHLSTDGLENFFGVVKSLQGCNRNLICLHFISAFKAALLTSYSSFTIKGTNCKNDYFSPIISCDDLVTKHTSQTSKADVESNQIDCEEDDNIPQVHLLDTDDNFLESLNLFFDDDIDDNDDCIVLTEEQIPEKIFRNVLRSISDTQCTNCQSNIYEVNEPSIQIMSENLKSAIAEAVNIFNRTVKPKLHEKNIGLLAITVMTSAFRNNWLTCSKHQVSLNSKIVSKVVTILIQQQCNILNRQVKFDEQKAANDRKISELSGKGK